MIVAMVRMVVATTCDRAGNTLEGLRDLGLLHVEHVKAPASSRLDDLKAQAERLDSALSLLPESGGPFAEDRSADAVELAGEIISLHDALKGEREKHDQLRAEEERIRPLGDFSPQDVSFLESRGLYFRLFRCDAGELADVEVPAPHVVVHGKGNVRYLACASTGEVSLPFELLPVPAESLSGVTQAAEAVRREISRVNKRLDFLAGYRSVLVEAREHLQRVVEFQEVREGMGTDGLLCYVRGYCPERETAAVAAEAGRRGWAVMWEPTDDETEVPTLVENPRWIRIIEPVMRLMGTVPGYREYDVSFVFLVSLSLFFAMLVGDGGYGLLFLAGAAAARRFFPGAPGEPFLLVKVFGAATVAWGLVTGTWFGVESLARVPVLGSLVIPAVDSYRGDGEFLMRLCFVLGAVHLSLAHALRAVREVRVHLWISEMGWICIIWCLYFVAETLVLGKPLPVAALDLLFFGIAGAVFFGGEGTRGWLHTVLAGIADMPLGIVRAFSDLVSYIRLFAVGYATLVVAMSFNRMASDLSDYGIVGPFIAAAVLIVGHGMNIALATMGVLVHGIRLNMLEFSSHLGMTWSGKPFRPFSSERPEVKNPSPEDPALAQAHSALFNQ